MPAGDYREYNSGDYFCSLSGIPLFGYAEDEFVKVEPESAGFEDVVGVDGEVTRSKSNDFRATVTVRLMQSSPVNDLLSALYNSDRNTPGGVGVGVFILRDKRGTTLFYGEKSWISQEPSVSLGRTVKEREWTIRIAKLVSTHGSTSV